MKQVRIKQLELQNFKGIRSLVVPFTQDTQISGANATGKTTIMDAFTWCLFGKDSKDRTDSGRGSFQVKTVDADGKVIEKLQHSVTAILEVTEDLATTSVVLTRSIEEEWSAKRGSAEVTLQGNVTHYIVNHIEVKASQYAQTVDNIIEERRFKLITNPTFFASLDWQSQREILMRVAGGNITYEQFASTNKEFADLLKRAAGVTLKDYKIQRAYDHKVVVSELEKCPVQIDAITRVMPQQRNFDADETLLASTQEQLATVDAQLTDAAKAVRIKYEAEQAKREEVYRLQAKQQDLIFAARKQANNDAFESNQKRNDVIKTIDTLKATFQEQSNNRMREMNSLSSKRAYLESKVAELNNRVEQKRAEWESCKSRAYDDVAQEIVCPILNDACSDPRVISAKELARSKASAAFYAKRMQDLAMINTDGKQLAEQLGSAKQELSEVSIQMRDIANTDETASAECAAEVEKQKALLATMREIKPQDPEPHSIPGFEELASRIRAINSTISDEPTAPESEELTKRKQDLQATLDECKTNLASRKTIEDHKREIAKIEARSKELAQQKADIEKEQFTIDALEHARMDAVEAKVNGMFKIVRFRMFEQQLNGGEAPTCVATVQGVRFADLNSAMKINAGLDIINTLSAYAQTYAPVFIDNAETVNELYPIASQTIRLVVTNEPELTISK